MEARPQEICVCVYMFWCMSTCVWRLEVSFFCHFSGTICLCFMRQCLLTWILLIRLGLLSSKPRGSLFVSASPTLLLQLLCSTISSLVLGLLQSTCLYNKTLYQLKYFPTSQSRGIFGNSSQKDCLEPWPGSRCGWLLKLQLPCFYFQSCSACLSLLPWCWVPSPIRFWSGQFIRAKELIGANGSACKMGFLSSSNGN